MQTNVLSYSRAQCLKTKKTLKKLSGKETDEDISIKRVVILKGTVSTNKKKHKKNQVGKRLMRTFQ